MAPARRSGGPSGCFLAIMALLGGLFALVAGVGALISEHKALFAAVGGLLLVGLIALMVRKLVQQQRVSAYRTAAAALARQKNVSMTAARKVLDLRARVARLPASVEAELERLYRQTVSEVVSDKRVEAAERVRLDTLRKGLSLSREAGQRAEVGGFLEAHASLVSDGRLTEAEEALLGDLEPPPVSWTA